jgi:hypothetical protein
MAAKRAGPHHINHIPAINHQKKPFLPQNIAQIIHKSSHKAPHHLLKVPRKNHKGSFFNL